MNPKDNKGKYNWSIKDRIAFFLFPKSMQKMYQIGRIEGINSLLK